MSALLVLLTCFHSAPAWASPQTASAGEFANLANPTDGQTPSVLSVWSDMQRSAPMPEGASQVTPSGKVAHGLSLPLPPALLAPGLGLSYQQGAGAHSTLGRGWRIGAGLTVRRPLGRELMAYVSLNGSDAGDGAVDVLVVSGDGLDGALYETATGWEWESTSPSAVHVTVQADGDLVLRSGTRRWELHEVVPNVWRTVRANDRSGNQIDYTWAENQLTRIDYGGHATTPSSTPDHLVRIELMYRDAAHGSWSSADGAPELIDERLDAVHVSTRAAGMGPPEIRMVYTFDYSVAGATFAEDEVLLAVGQASDEAGSDWRMLQRFEYTELDLDQSEAREGTQPRILGQSGTFRGGADKRAVNATQFRLEDWSHDGLPDVVNGYPLSLFPMVRSWVAPVGELSFYELPSQGVEISGDESPLVPASVLPGALNVLDETQVRVLEPWNYGMEWGRNASFTTAQFIDVNGDGWLDRVRSVDVGLQGYLDDAATAVMPIEDHPFRSLPYTWEVCYGEAGGLWDYDCRTVSSPFVAPRIGTREVVPLLDHFFGASYDSTDLRVELIDMNHDGWLDLVHHDGAEVVYYPHAGDALEPFAARAAGWEFSSPISSGDLVWSDGTAGMTRARNHTRTEGVSIDEGGQTQALMVYASEETAGVRDLDGDGRVDRVVVPDDFDVEGLWEVYFADDDGFSDVPVPWPAPRAYLGRSDEGKPNSIIASMAFCAGDLPVGGVDGIPLTELIAMVDARPRWDPGDLLEEEGCFETNTCTWMEEYWLDDPWNPCTDPTSPEAQIFEVCEPDAYLPTENDIAADMWADLHAGIEYDPLDRNFQGFDRLVWGRPRAVTSGLIDIDADGRVDFFDGLEGVWHRNLGDGFDDVGTTLPTWWPTRDTMVSDGVVAPTHVLEVSLTTQYVISLAQCVYDGSSDYSQVVGSDSHTDVKLRVMDANGDGLLDVVHNQDPSVLAPGITYAGGYEPQTPPGLLRRVTTNTLLDVDFAYMNSVEVYPNGHAEQSVPMVGHGLGAETLVASMTVSDPFMPVVTPTPLAPPLSASWTRHYTYDMPLCGDGRCWGYNTVLMEDELRQRDPGGNGPGATLWSYTDTNYDRPHVLGPFARHVYIGDGAVGASTDRFHLETALDNGVLDDPDRRVYWPKEFYNTETRVHPTTGVASSRQTKVLQAYDPNGHGTVEDVWFDVTDGNGTPVSGPASVHQHTEWVGDSYGALFVPEEQWVYGESGVLVERAKYAYDDGAVGAAPTKGLLTSQELASGPQGTLDSAWISWTFERDPRGQVEVAILPNGLQTARAWTEFGGALWSTETVTGDFGQAGGGSESFVTTQTVDEQGRVVKTVGPNGNGSETVFDVWGRPVEQWRFGAPMGVGAAKPFLVSTTGYHDAREEGGQRYPARVQTTSFNHDAGSGNFTTQTTSHQLLDAHGRPAITYSQNEEAGYRISGVRQGVLDQELTTWSDVQPILGTDIEGTWDLSTIPQPAIAHVLGWGTFDGLGELQEGWTLDAGTVHHTYPEPGQHGTAQFHTGDAGQGQECYREESKLLVSDPRGRLVRVEEGTNAAIGNGDVTGTYTYDANGRVASFVNGVGDVLAYQYDGIGRLRTVQAGRDAISLSTWVEYGYDDPIPTPTWMEMAGESSMVWTYDDLGRTVKQEALGRVAGVDEVTEWFWDGQWKGAVDSVTFPSHHGEATLSYTYDGNASSFAYDQEGWLTEETLTLPDGAGGTDAYTFLYEHDAEGRVTRTEWPSGGLPLAVETAYSPNGNAKNQAVLWGTPGGPLSKSLVYTLDYDNWGNLAGWATTSASDWDAPDDAFGLITHAAPSKVEDLVWNVDGSMRSVLYDHCGDDAVLYSRTYDNGVAPSESFTYHYDAFNRIGEVEHSAFGFIEDYTYDLANNPMTARVGATAPTQSYDYADPAFGGLGAPPSYQRASVAAGDVLEYDDGERVTSRKRAGVERGFVYDGQSRVVQGTLTNGAATATRDYWYAPGNGVVEEAATGAMAGTTHRFQGFRMIDGVPYASVLPWLTIRNGQAVYTLDEPDGRAAMMLDVNGVALSERYVSAYGVELYGSGAVDWPLHGMHGSEPDEALEVVHFGARHMSLRGGGMWLQREPLLHYGVEAGDLTEPRSFGGAYGLANPLVWSDLSGHRPDRMESFATDPQAHFPAKTTWDGGPNARRFRIGVNVVGGAFLVGYAAVVVAPEMVAAGLAKAAHSQKAINGRTAAGMEEASGIPIATGVAGVAPLASKGAGRVVALGKTDGLDAFAAKVGGQSYRDLKWGSRTGKWQDDFLESLYDDGTHLRVNLDGVEGGAWQAASRSASGRGSPMDWELSQIYQSPDRWSNILWFEAGQEVANPFQ